MAQREQRAPVDVAADDLAVRHRRIGRGELKAPEQKRHLAPRVGAVAPARDRPGRLVVAVVLADLGRRRRHQLIEQQRAADGDGGAGQRGRRAGRARAHRRAGRGAVGQRRDGDGEHGDRDHAADARSRWARAARYARRSSAPGLGRTRRHHRRSIALVADQHDRMVVPRRVGDGERDDLGIASARPARSASIRGGRERPRPGGDAQLRRTAVSQAASASSRWRQ